MKNKLKKVSIDDLLGIFKFILILIPALVYKLYLKVINKQLWLICETKVTARDNGFVFYQYMKNNHPEIKSYYAINKECEDYNKVKEYGNIIEWSSLLHYFYYISATYNISSHKEGNPNQSLFTVLHLYLRLFNNRVFLQHGITKDDAEMFYYKNTYFKYFICGAKREYKYILKRFGYPPENVAYTGFSRFDNLHNFEKKKQILLIPTWRRWFELMNDEKKFKESYYYKKWNSFLNNQKLNDILTQENIELIFYPHAHMKKFINCFNIKGNKIKIINDELDIQKLLIESSLMITDYSSVYMDFAYMKKPVIYYQFDYEEYRKSHFKEGYFSYEKDGFGPVYMEESKLIDEIYNTISHNFIPEEKYLKRMDNFFELNDKHNCDRIYEKIIGCDNK